MDPSWPMPLPLAYSFLYPNASLAGALPGGLTPLPGLSFTPYAGAVPLSSLPPGLAQGIVSGGPASTPAPAEHHATKTDSKAQQTAPGGSGGNMEDGDGSGGGRQEEGGAGSPVRGATPQQQLTAKAALHAVQGYPSAASLLSLAAAANAPPLGSLHSSSTALPLLSEGQLGPGAGAAPGSATQPPADAAAGGPAPSDGGHTLAIMPLTAEGPAPDVTATDAAVRYSGRGAAAPSTGPTQRMRKVGSTTSLPAFVEGAGGGPRCSPSPGAVGHAPSFGAATRSGAQQGGGAGLPVTSVHQVLSGIRAATGDAMQQPSSALARTRHASLQDLSALDSSGGFRAANGAGGRRASSGRGGGRGGGLGQRGSSVGGGGGGGGGGGLPRISSLQALVEVAAAAAEDTTRSGGGGRTGASRGATDSGLATQPESDDDDEEGGGEHMHITDETELKRLKRKQSNRESARRSRLKKQAEADALSRATAELHGENSALRGALSTAQALINKLATEKAQLMSQVQGLGGQLPAGLDWPLPIIPVPAPVQPSLMSNTRHHS